MALSRRNLFKSGLALAGASMMPGLSKANILQEAQKQNKQTRYNGFYHCSTVVWLSSSVVRRSEKKCNKSS